MSNKSLSERLKFWRAERPDEWVMDEFIRDAEVLERQHNKMAAQHEWQPIETAPLGKAVLVFYDNNSRRKRIIKAQYVNAYTEEASEESIDCGFYDYCGETDEYYTPEGWYELVDNSCDYSSYGLEAANKPTHWMPLPQPPEEQ